MTFGVATDRPCDCLCTQHRAYDVHCDGDATDTITLAGGTTIGPQPVPMCTPCATWWRTHRTWRVHDEGPAT